MVLTTARLCRRLTCAALAAAAITASGCGSGGDEGPDPGVAEIAPANASLYADAVLRPEGDQKAKLEDFLSAVLDTSDPGAKITDLIDQAFRKDGEDKTFADDVDPWLGDRGGVFTVGFQDNPPAVAAVEASDPDAGVRLLESESKSTTDKDYNGVAYEIDENGDAFGAIGDFVAQGDETAFKAAIDASKGDSLADSERFNKAIGDVPSDALASTYLDLHGLIEQTAVERNVPKNIVDEIVSKLGIGDSLVASASAGDKSLGLDLGGLPESTADAPSELLAGLPSDAWLAVGAGNVGGRVNSLLKTIGEAGIPGVTGDTIALGIEQQAGLDLRADITDWLGDAAVFVRGTDPSNLDGALVLESKDDAAAAQAMNDLRDAVQQQGRGSPKPLELGSGGNGFTLEDPAFAQPLNFVQQNGKVVIGYGDAATQAALSPSKTLAKAPGFTAASGSIGGGGPQFYVSAPEAVDLLAKDPNAKADPSFAKILPYLQRLAYITAGGAEGGLKIVVGAK
ncbi:MAG: DUF3352 domain-containing protein [Solirubrobacterales bacterium]